MKAGMIRKYIAIMLALAQFTVMGLPVQAAFNSKTNPVTSSVTSTYSNTNTTQSLQTAATGTNYVSFASQPCRSLTVFNNTGTTIEVQRNASGATIPVFSGSSKLFENISNANQLQLRRSDTTNTQVTVTAEIAIQLEDQSIINPDRTIMGFSLDKLRTQYSGPALRVRRSLDNAEQDIYFNSLNGLDTATLLAFCAGGSGFVKTWYDESGWGRDVTQSTTANQPRIVNNGVLDTMGGRPAIFFDGVNDSLFNSGAGMPTGSSPFTVNVRLKFGDSTQTPTRTFLKWGAESLNTGLIMTRDTNSDLWVRTGNGQYVASSERNIFSKSETLVNDGTTFKGYLDGLLTTWLNLPPTYNIVAGNFTIGNNAITFANPFYGTINEVLVFNTNLSTGDRVALEKNQDARNNIQPLYNLIFDGDSITVAQLGTTTYLNGWRYLLMNSLLAAGKPFKTITVALNGQSATTQDNLAKSAGGLDGMIMPSAVRTILFAMLGKNDIGNESNTPAQAYADYVTYVTNRKATNKYDRIVVFTTTPSVSDAGSALMTQFSNLVRNGMKTVANGGTGELLNAGATDLIDLQQADDGTGYKPFADPSGWNNPTYIYATDKIHPTDAGQALIFNQVRSTLGL